MELELYNGTLCITGTEFIRSESNPDGFVSKSMYDNMCIQDPELRKRRANGVLPALIAVDRLNTKYQDLVYKKYPNPKEQADAKPFIDAIRNDPDAVEFFRDKELKLSDPEQEECVNNANVLNMFKEELISYKSAHGRGGHHANITTFWNEMATRLPRFCDKCKHSLPSNPRRLQEKYEKYIDEGYKALITGRKGNQNTTKITDEVGDWLIARYASQINRVTLNQLWREYNRLAPESGWKPIKTEQTIRLYLDKEEIRPLWYGGRYGELAAKELFERQHRTLLPTLRDSLWYGDGTKLNYFYRNEDGKPCTCNVYEVVDVYSEVLLGYHISKTENHEAQFMAYKMALQTSGHKPYEIVYDNQGGHKALVSGDFLKNLAHLPHSTRPYNGKSKTIESIFKRFQESCLHRDPFFTGQNITATKTESHANMEWVLANEKNLPTLEEVKKLYKQRRDEWNNGEHFKTGRCRMDMYRSSINPNSKQVEILDMIQLFWIKNEKEITYRASGLKITICKVDYAYEVLTGDGQPDAAFRIKNVGRKFIVKYDPDDMSIIALYENTPTGLRLASFAQTYLYIHRAKQDQEDGEAEFIKAQEIAAKVERVKNREDLEDRLERHGLHPEQHGYVMPKTKGISKKELERYSYGQYVKDLSNANPEEIESDTEEVMTFYNKY